MNPLEDRDLRRLARALRLPADALETAGDCGLFTAGQTQLDCGRVLRQMRRLMDDLGVNAPAAALLVRMARDLQALQSEIARLRYVETRYFAVWDEGEWRDA